MSDKLFAAAITSSNMTSLGGLVAERKTKSGNTVGEKLASDAPSVKAGLFL